MLCKKDICCPVCRALCCVFNERDTCMKYTPGEAPGYDCPDFFARNHCNNKNGHSGRMDIRTFMLDRGKDESKQRSYETNRELEKWRSAKLPATVFLLDDLG